MERLENHRTKFLSIFITSYVGRKGAPKYVIFVNKGLTDSMLEKAPLLNGIRYLPLVVVASGKTIRALNFSPLYSMAVCLSMI